MELRLSHGYVVLLTWVELGADELEEERLADEVGEVVDAAGGVDDADGRLHGHRGGHRQRPVHRHGRRHAGGLLDGAAPRRREPTGALLPGPAARRCCSWLLQHAAAGEEAGDAARSGEPTTTVLAFFAADSASGWLG